MTLQTVGSFGWVPVAVANVQGNPGGFPNGAQIQSCRVKFSVLHSTLSMEDSLNISSEVTSNAGIRRYLTADENLITFGQNIVGQLTANRVQILNSIMTANPPVNVVLDFTQSPGLPRVNIT